MKALRLVDQAAAAALETFVFTASVALAAAACAGA
jgi:hypothetical protein